MDFFFQVIAHCDLVRKALQHLSSLCMTMSSMTFELNLNDATSTEGGAFGGCCSSAAAVGHTTKGKTKFPTMSNSWRSNL